MKKDNKSKLLLASAINKSGNVIFDYVNSIWIVGLPYGSFFLGVYQSTQYVVLLCISTFSGYIVDRINVKKLLIILNIINFLICFILIILKNFSGYIYILILANIILAFATSLTSPATKKMLILLVSKDELFRYNSLNNISLRIISIFSPLVGIIILMLFTREIAIAWNAFSFLIVALLYCCVQVENEQYIKKEKKVFFSSYKKAISTIYMDKELFHLIILISLSNFFIIVNSYCYPFLSNINVLYNINMYSIILILNSIGSIVGSFIFYKLNNGVSFMIIAVLVLTMGIINIFIPFALTYKYYSLILFLLIAMIETVLSIYYLGYVQMKVDKKNIGKVFGLITMLSFLFIPLGIVIASLLYEKIQKFLFLYSGVGLVIISIFAIIMYQKNKCCIEKIEKGDTNFQVN